jgi:hypothetical protein
MLLIQVWCLENAVTGIKLKNIYSAISSAIRDIIGKYNPKLEVVYSFQSTREHFLKKRIIVKVATCLRGTELHDEVYKQLSARICCDIHYLYVHHLVSIVVETMSPEKIKLLLNASDN